MIRAMFLLIFAIIIDALQALFSAVLSVALFFPGTVGAAVGATVGGKVAGAVGAKAGAAVGAAAATFIPGLNAAATAAGGPIGFVLGFVISFCISATFGFLLCLGLKYCGMFYWSHIFSAFTGEAIPGLNLLPAWTALVVRSWWKKTKLEKADKLTKLAMQVGPKLVLPNTPIGDAVRRGNAEGMKKAAQVTQRATQVMQDISPKSYAQTA